MREIIVATLLLACASNRGATTSVEPHQRPVPPDRQPEPEVASAADTADTRDTADTAQVSLAEDCPVPEGWVGEQLFTAVMSVRFMPGTTTVAESGRRAIDIIVDSYMRGLRGLRIRLRGHRDRGEDKALALLRAEALSTIFVERGIPAGCIVVVDGGAEDPVDRDGSPINSRVEFQVILRGD